MMANLSEDIQSAGSDTLPPMLDRSNFESWQQRIRLYYLGKENGENIFQSIDDGPFKMGKFRETLVDGALGPERDIVVKDLTPEEKERYKADCYTPQISEAFTKNDVADLFLFLGLRTLKNVFISREGSFRIASLE
ncbi:hypothetical protein Tco_1499763 [Tanacetum coccineum]